MIHKISLAFYSKKYIWNSKFEQLGISFIGFKCKLHMYASDLSSIFLRRKMLDYNEIWNFLTDALSVYFVA